MFGVASLSEALLKGGFVCQRCGACCQGEADTSRVIISPPEIDAIEAITGDTHSEIVTPYPELLESENGGSYTFEWCLRMENKRCRFYSDDSRCTIYAVRPWICRTYPFALNGESLIISECPGVGQRMTKEEADALASALLLRNEAEEEEERAVEAIFLSSQIPRGKVVVFDSRGMWSIHG
jgi:hypothetical protein